MKKFKKIASLVISAAMLTSSFAFAVTANAAEASEAEAVVAASTDDASLQSEVGDGVILHAFNWSYNTIKENLPAIAAAGYSTVQTSPVQQPKDYGTSMDVAGQWWKLYQPVSMSIAQSTWLGTKAELTSLCTEADKYGIKIICDIVSNHFGNEIEGDPNSVSSQVATYQPDFYQNKSTYFHSYTGSADDSSIQGVVQGHVSSCPDLNTGDTNVQNAVVSLLKECIDCGVDGFRFDAAKHIETPSDGTYASQYWPNITSAAEQYYTAKTGGNLYIYGEILNTCGTGRSYNAYTPYINVTDNRTGDAVLYYVTKGNAASAASSSYKSGVSASKAVIWAESHDTYEGTSGSAGIANTATVSDENIVKAWAIVAARKDSTALYFARPGSALMGEAATDTTYKSTAVAEINKFHNNFVGQSEKLGSSGSVAYVARGTSGIVLSNTGGTTASVSISGTGIADGTYTDTVSGNKFTVSGGVLTGTIGSTGVAVVYDASTTPRNTVSVESGSFQGETMTVKLGLDNATSGTYSLDGSAPVKYTSPITIRIGSDYNYGDTINFTVTATDGQKTTSTLYKYTKKESTSSGVYLFLNKANRPKWTAPLYAYIYDETTDSEYTYKNAAWPGQALEYDEASGYYYLEVPTTSLAENNETKEATESSFDLAHSANTWVIFHGSVDGQQYPADGSSKHLAINGSSKIFALTSTTSFGDTTLTPYIAPIEEATDVTRGEAPEPTTIAPTTTPTVPVGSRLYGDADNDGEVSIDDATLIQKYIVELKTMPESDNEICDTDDDGSISIDDATCIQKYLAEMSETGRTGQICGTQPTTAQPTTAQPTTAQPTTAAPTTVPAEPSSTFYIPNYVSWLTSDGGKLWIYNDATAEFVLMEYDADTDCFFIDLPDDWKTISIYRTPFDTTEDEFDINSNWDDNTQSGIVLNKWVDLPSRGSYNCFKITGDGLGLFETYDPSAPIETERTIYFDNRSANWSTVYIYGWSFGLNQEFVEMTNEGNGIWSYTFTGTLPTDGVNGFLFVNKNSWSGQSQTSDLATQAGKNLFTPSSSTGTSITGTWSVYNP